MHHKLAQLNPFVAALCRSLTLIGLLMLMSGGWSFISIAQAQTDPTELAQVVESVEELDLLRQGLATSIDMDSGTPTLETFKQVCKPVGMQAKRLSQENGWQVKQIAAKYRNPAHAPDTATAEQALDRFAQDPDLMGFWARETLNQQPGSRYYRRINVEATCLACHGAKDSRPGFVRDTYPQDLAFDFEVGDLRGMYAVFVPDLQETLAAIEP